MRVKTPYQPEEVGYVGSRIDVLEKHFDKMMGKGELQGDIYCLTRAGKQFALGSQGVLEYEKNCQIPMPVNAIFKIASITKFFTAVAVMKLVEDGYFRLDQPVSILLDEFKKGPFQEITFAQLLTHTSGLQPDSNCFENPYFLSPFEIIDRTFEKGDADWLEKSLGAGLRTKPGEEWAYSTFGFVVLGEAISRAVGFSVHAFIKQEILVPCEMTDSGFEEHLRKEDLPRIATSGDYTAQIKSRLKEDKPMSEAEKLWRTMPETGGGLFSTVEDLSKFGNMLLNNGFYNGTRVIGRKAIEKMTSRHTDSSIKEYCWNAGGVERAYALGPDIRNNLATTYSKGTFYHEGAGACCVMIDPAEELVASWYVPFRNDGWYADGLYNASTIMWSGLK